MSKIFIINPKGEVHQLNNSIIKTYHVLNEIVEELFPPLDGISDKVNNL
jgi:phosphatidate phosphatase PAH1